MGDRVTGATRAIPFFGNSGDAPLLDQAIEQGRAELAAARQRQSRMVALGNLAAHLEVRFNFTHRVDDLDQAITLGGEAITLADHSDPRRAIILNNLASALLKRYAGLGRRSDLDEAVSRAQDCVAIAVEDQLALGSSTLSAVLRSRFERDGLLSDLDDAIVWGQRAIALAPKEHENHAVANSTLALALSRRFTITGELSDIDDAIRAGRRALVAAANQPNLRIPFLANLASYRFIRYDTTFDLADLDDGIALLHEAKTLVPAGNPLAASLRANLSYLLAQRSAAKVTTGEPDVADLSEAIRNAREALEWLPQGHRFRVTALNGLSWALQLRSILTHEAPDLEESIRAARDALANTPHGDIAHTTLQSNLAIRLFEQAEATKSSDVRSEAIREVRAALASTPEEHPGRARLLSVLGILLSSSAEGEAGAADPIGDSLAAFRSATTVTTASVSRRCMAAWEGGLVAASKGRWHEAHDMFGVAIDLLPQAAARSLGRVSQEALIQRHLGLASQACTAALQNDELAAAAGRLEQARGILLAQAIESRTDLTNLREQHPELAVDFERTLASLDAGSIGNLDQQETPHTRAHRAEHLRNLDGHRLELLARIRRLPGLEGFLVPPSPGDLQKQACDGPIVMLNVGYHRSDALVVTKHGIDSVPLPKLTDEGIERQLDIMMSATNDPTGFGRNSSLHGVLDWMWDAIAAPILERLGLVGPPLNEPWPRLWWVPTGPLTMLPLHAAGDHRSDTGSSVLDRVVSSYSPTVAALRHARAASTATAGSVANPVIVSMPTTPSYGGEPRPAELPGAYEEAMWVARRLESTYPPLIVEQATSDRVLSALRTADWAHLACHADSDINHPTGARLLLHDRALGILEVSALRLKARLAFLSACASARGGGYGLLDEAIHLASTFQLAGFTHVIGTLWPIADYIAPRVARYIYENLESDAANAASAVQQAVRRLRLEMPDKPLAWASHIHIGP